MPIPALKISQGTFSVDELALVRRLDRVLYLSERAVGLLGPDGYRDAEDKDLAVKPEKVISETGLLLLAASSVSAAHPDIAAHIDRIARLLVPYARSEKMLSGLCMNPSLARDYGFTHLCLSRLGFPDEGVERLFRLSLEAETALSHERVPYRMLEQTWMARLAAMSDSPATAVDFDPEILKHTMMGRPLDIFAATGDDLYAFTHAVIYVSEFGLSEVELPRPADDIFADAEGALACALDREDYDLGGEMLLTWPYLRRELSPPAAFAFRVLSRVEDEAGFLPTSLTRLDRYYALQGSERAKYAMTSIYHTAYVMGLLCVALLNVPRLNVKEVFAADSALPPPTAGTDRVRELLKFIDNEKRAPHWMQDFSALTPAEQDELAPMLLVIALKRAVDLNDFEKVRSLLMLALDLEMTDIPAVAQASDLLKRCTTLAGLL